MKVRVKNTLLAIVLITSCNIDVANKTTEVIEYEELSFKDEKGYYEGQLYTGLVVVRHPNGEKKFESAFVDGVEDGQFKEWDEKGNLLEKANSENGRLHGKYMRYYPSGQKLFEGTYEEGNLEGPAFQWHENGQLKMEYSYSNSFQHGWFSMWNNKGVKLLEGQMKYSERDGKWYEYNPKAKKAIINYYDNGELLRSEEQEQKD